MAIPFASRPRRLGASILYTALAAHASCNKGYEQHLWKFKHVESATLADQAESQDQELSRASKDLACKLTVGKNGDQSGAQPDPSFNFGINNPQFTLGDGAVVPVDVVD